MLEITIDNCYKCDLETINDPNNSQYLWINRRDLEIETECNWQVIFDKYKDLLTQKYRKESTPNITFQPNEIFERNDLFEKIIKSCKATNLEFLKLKEKLGLCLYEDICDEQELILTSEEIFKEKIIPQHDVENKQSKEKNEQLKKENEQLKKNNIDAKVKESIEKSIEIKSLLAIIDSNQFNYRNKIGEFKYIGMRDLVDNITNNTPPRWNSPCHGEGAYSLSSSNQCINKWSSSERCCYVR